MKKLLVAALLALGSCALTATPSLASAFGLIPHGHCCQFCFPQYNAFSPIGPSGCCVGQAGGCCDGSFDSGCCKHHLFGGWLHKHQDGCADGTCDCAGGPVAAVGPGQPYEIAYIPYVAFPTQTAPAYANVQPVSYYPGGYQAAGSGYQPASYGYQPAGYGYQQPVHGPYAPSYGYQPTGYSMPVGQPGWNMAAPFVNPYTPAWWYGTGAR
jgi:hypothetical protein